MDEAINNEQEKLKININGNSICNSSSENKSNINTSFLRCNTDKKSVDLNKITSPSKKVSGLKSPIKCNFMLPFESSFSRKVSFAPQIKQIKLREKISSKTVV